MWILIDIVQWGFITKYLGSLGQDTFSFITVILGAIILWEFMSRITGIMMSFLRTSDTEFIIFLLAAQDQGYLSGIVLTA
jgi:ABC-2 type transport system permease protein